MEKKNFKFKFKCFSFSPTLGRVYTHGLIIIIIIIITEGEMIEMIFVPTGVPFSLSTRGLSSLYTPSILDFFLLFFFSDTKNT